MNKKTVFYIDPQSYGNLARYDYYLLSNMTENIVFLGSKLYNFKPLDNVQYRPIFSYSKYRNPLLKTFSYFCSLVVLFFLVWKYKPSCIHIQWFKIPILDYQYYKLLKSFFRFKIVHTAHNILPHNTGERYADTYNKLYHLSDAIIVHTPNTKKEIVEKFSLDDNKVNVIRHGLMKLNYDEDRYQNLKQELDEKYKLQGKYVFVSLGEQSDYKGFKIFIQAWLSTPELRDNDNVALVIAGTILNEDISEISKCRNVIINNSFISEEEFIYWLRRADTYLLVYREISQSGALLTALTEQVPVLVSNLDGLTEPLRVAGIGWSIEKLSSNCLAEKMKYLIAHPEEAQAIKSDDAIWSKIGKYFSWESISKATQALYCERAL